MIARLIGNSAFDPSANELQQAPNEKNMKNMMNMRISNIQAKPPAMGAQCISNFSAKKREIVRAAATVPGKL